MMNTKSTFGSPDFKFYPCYLDIENIKKSLMFGWNEFFTLPETELTTGKLFGYLKGFPHTTHHITEEFETDKIHDLCQEYEKYMVLIRRTIQLTEKMYEKDYVITDQNEQTAKEWEDAVHLLYEKYRIAESVFEKVLYDSLLYNLLWNSMLDPRNPKIVSHNLERILSLRNSVETGTLTETSIFKRGKNLFKKYKIDVDEDGSLLIKKNYKSDLFRSFNNSNRVLKIYRDKNMIEEMKPELAKLYYINELIEIKYIYNQKMSKKEKEDSKKYIRLRANLLSAFKEYLTHVLKHDKDFNFIEYYENSPYAEVFRMNREQLRGVGNMIRLLLGVK